MLGLIGRVAEVAREHALRPVFHPHAGGYVEFEDGIERLVEDTDSTCASTRATPRMPESTRCWP
jgi:hypothetical protein